MMQILVAEDDIVSGKLLQKILNKFGDEVLLVDNGHKAWERLQGNGIRMVITDWMMPGMTGLELCRNIREAKLDYYIYIILVTAKDRKEDIVEGLNIGADDYLVKPIDPEGLIARVRAGKRIIKLEENYKNAHAQLLQSEKMASVGQLAAGVAHEINNPTGFVSSNLKTLSDYQHDIIGLVDEYREFVTEVKNSGAGLQDPASILERIDRIMALEGEKDIDFILNDAKDLIEESKEGAERIKKIVADLKDFAHPGNDKLQDADINKCIESTLNVVWNEIKYKAKVKKEYGALPLVECYPQQLNQVIMNILVNAAQAIENQGEITISTRGENGYVEIEMSDTGPGIPKENLSRIFDPFFTTKEVGKGTGLGLNVAYNIIKKHKGTIHAESEMGKGTTFIIRIPMNISLP